ncbi:Aureobasidin resistance protein Aur1 [Haplosporangium sp. Z 767]|nr:Aureobasidin resistance protein Aur1 [Haplosporangium sp. Z 11]KAF9180410.1 Aureobasidin resistance protein Aur1 [Haplosporangium sp. Z 767]
MVSLPRGLNRVQQRLKFAVKSTIRPLQQHHYTLYDLQYLFLFVLFTFCYWIMEKPVWFKLPIALTAVGLLIPRRTRQFMLPFLAVAAWLLLFYCCRFIPSEWRPHIFTSVLPALENILYGGSISELLARSTSPFKDILAWIPYGVLHYVLPIVTAILIVLFGPPGTLPVFARTFGYMNVAGVLTQIFFPCAPPWYETRYGNLQPAAYTMPGDPGGLARVDDILGVQMYKTTFTASPLVFGAFPSLHSAVSCQLAFFLVYVFGPRSIPFALAYVFWVWWATMYLGHHYVVDLVGGGAYAVIAFWIGSFFLPSVLPSSMDQDMDLDLEHGLTKKGFTDLGEASDRYEKQTLFQAPGEDNEEEYTEAGSSSGVGSSSSSSNQNMDKTWDLGEDEDDEEETGLSNKYPTSFDGRGVDVVELSSVVINVNTLAGLEIEEVARLTRSEPSSPIGNHHSSSSSSSTTVTSWTQKTKTKTKKNVATSKYRQSWNGWQGYESWIEVLATVNSPKTSPRSSPKNSPANSPSSSTLHLAGAPL